MPDRAERIALNESRFREINDQLAADLAELRNPPERLELVCECALLECRAQILLTQAEYRQVRTDPILFAVACGHEIPDVEEVIERTDRFYVIRKPETVRHVVEETEPSHGEGGT